MIKELIDLNKAQITREIPMLRDVLIPTLKRHKVYPFTRLQQLGTITSSTTAEVTSALTFSLSSLPDYTEFTGLFDAYRIVGVKVCFYPAFLDTTATTLYPPIYTVIDYDDSNTTSTAAYGEYDSCQVVQTGQYFERTLVPRVAIAAYSGAFTSFGQKAKMWIDCGSPSVNHYGLKYGIDIAGAANTLWTAVAHYSLEFRESR
jgi:hypothetical protein